MTVERQPSQAITILLVEDDAPTLWRLREALIKAGFEVKAAANLAEARDSLAQGAPRVLLTDLQLPDGHGNDLIRETRARFFHARCKFRLRHAYGRGSRQKTFDISIEERPQCFPRKCFFGFFPCRRDWARPGGGFLFFFRGIEDSVDAIGQGLQFPSTCGASRPRKAFKSSIDSF